MVYYDVGAFCRDHFRPHKVDFVLDKHKKFLRIGAGFDIETTRKDTYAFMYIWQFSFGDDVVTGRTWYAFDMLMQQLQMYMDRLKCRIIVWVANLGHEFAFLGRRYHWESVFARESHQPLHCCTGHIEFRECLSISGQGGLKNLAKNYTQTQKAVGDLDYTKMRNSQTPIDSTEMRYAVNDVKILSEWGEYIFKEYSDNGQAIPLTKTGIIRNMIKQAAALTGGLQEIKKAVKALYPNRPTYNFIMQYLFRGGYTHANAWWVMVQWDNVIAADFTSSYPAVMLHCYYPKSEFIPLELQTDGRLITDPRMMTHCVWFNAVFVGIEAKTMHTIESEHKCIAYQNARFDNGRLLRADRVRVALTEIDYQIYTMFYTWESIEIHAAFYAIRGRLPEYVLRPLREAYQTKARIKKDCKKRGINPDSIPEYRNAKATINSYYGVMVQRLNFTDWVYDEITGEWSAKETNKTYQKMIANVILSPWWGIYVTAHARLALLGVVAEMDTSKYSTNSCNVLYCDTDSIYMDDTPRNREIINAYNEKIAAMNAELPAEFADIGCFDWIGGTDADGNPHKYSFKTIGAKRYIKYSDGQAEVTVAGMRKGTLERSIVRQFATDNSYVLYEDPEHKQGKIGYVDVNELFDVFTDGYCQACDESNKNAAIYEPTDYEAEIVDEYGNREIMHEKCGVAIVPITFSVKMDDVYLQLLKEIMENRRIPIWK